MHTEYFLGQTIYWSTKTYLNKFKRIKVIQSIYFNYNKKKFKISNLKRFRTFKNMWKLNDALLNNQ